MLSLWLPPTASRAASTSVRLRRFCFRQQALRRRVPAFRGIISQIVFPSRLEQDEDDFLFEKGQLNLWAEPVQWVGLLHRHLCSLVEALGPVPGGVGPELEQRTRSLTSQARAKVRSSQQALDSLPPLPHFSCTAEHSRLLLCHQRASLTLDVLERLRETS